ncbi:MAG TPA: GAF domain-containing protein, partial [Aggregatilineales bacterium]|nr:GAF domain-containing protein [Aggregatilineales bacterium]
MRDAIHIGNPSATRDIATDHASVSMIALPLRIENEIIGVLAIYGSEPDTFDDSETALLVELARDLGHGIKVLRNQAERQPTEAELAEERNLLHTLIDTLPLSIFIKDTHGRLILNNLAHNKMQGVASSTELLGKTVFDYYPPDLASQYYAKEQELFRTGIAQIDEEELRRDPRTGGPLWNLTTKVPLRDRQGQITGLVGITYDITQRKEMGGALQRRDALLDALAAISGDFLRFADVAAVLSQVIARLGRAVDVSRVQIYENVATREGDAALHLSHEWTAEGIHSTRNSPTRQDVPYSSLPGWHRTLVTGGTVSGLARDFPSAAKTGLALTDTLSCVFVPIVYSDEFWGVLGFSECSSERHWLPVEIEAMRSGSSALGSALLRQRTEAAEREQRALAEALRDTVEAISSSLQIDEVLDRILASLDRVVPNDATNVMLLDHDVARVVRGRGYAQRGLEAEVTAVTFKLDEIAHLKRAVETRQVQIVSDTRTSPTWQLLSESLWIRSYIVAPIIVDDQIIGLLNLDSATPGKYSARDAERLRAFTDQAAVALHNAQLYATTRQNVAELETLQQLSMDLTARLDPDSVMRTLTQGALKLVGARAGGLFLYRPHEDVLELVVSIGTDPVGTQCKRGEGLVGRVFESRTPMSVASYETWDGKVAGPVVRTMGAVIAVPILWQGDLLGVF